MERNNDIKWLPLQNMTPIEMSETMKKSKVYIDFGNHPGKDRIPREAAISGCCVITGKRGSAKYKQDVNIDDEFKFNDNEAEFENIRKKILEIFNNYEDESLKFNKYREIIMNEEERFEKDLKEIFCKIIK
ncbi:hypothetical protein H9X77_10020 [Clostridium saudiense]|nr:hypothetical protein [Clostridium saudiense]